MAINSTRGICSTFSTTVDHRGSNSRSGHRVRQNERRAAGLSCDAKLQIAIKRQNNKKVVVLCHGSVSQRGVAAALRSPPSNSKASSLRSRPRRPDLAENTHPYHVQAGNWIREHRGIYRLALFPAPDRPDLVLWSLWLADRKEEVDGVYSHQTALSLYELSDLNPAKLHMTVPTNFGVTAISLNCHSPLSRPAQERNTGRTWLQIHSPLRTILDLIEAGTVERTFIRQALRQAVDRGLITRQQLRNAQLSETARKMVEDALRRAA